MSLERFISVGGLRLFVRAHGERERPPLVLLHDLAESADAFQRVADGLAEQFFVVTPDQRGHGDSDWIDTYSPQEMGDDIGELIEVLGVGPANILGIGMGARAALLLAARQSHTVDRVVAMETARFMYHDAERRAATALLDLPRVYHSSEDYFRTWQTLRHELGLRARPGCSYDLPPDAVERLLRPLTYGGLAPKCDLDGITAYRAWSPGPRIVDYHDELSEIMSPVLVVRAEYSTVTSAADLTDAAAVIPDCRATTLPAAHHDVLADAPDALVRAVLPFLSGEG